jgi:hypothetical protein
METGYVSLLDSYNTPLVLVSLTRSSKISRMVNREKIT